MMCFKWLLLPCVSAQVLITGYCACPAGISEPYNDATECEAAANSLGITYGGVLAFYFRTQEGPAGCWHHTANDIVYWNPDDGDACETVAASSVCVPGPTTTSSTATSMTTSSSTATSTSKTETTSTSSSQTSTSQTSTSQTSTSSTSSTTSTTSSSTSSFTTTVSNTTTTQTTSETTSFSTTTTESSTSFTVSLTSSTSMTETSSTLSSVTVTTVTTVTSTVLPSTATSTTSSTYTSTSSTSWISTENTMMQSTSTRTSRTSQIVVTPTDDPDTSSEMNESEFNESNLTTVQADWTFCGGWGDRTTMQLSFALAGCYTSDVLAWQGLLQGSWIQLPALAFGAFMSLALLLLFCICCGSPAPLPLLELARGDAAQRPPPRRKVVGGWAVKIVDRCAMFIRCYRAGLTERTLLVMQEGTTLSKRQTWADAREEAAMVANLHTQAVLILESFGNPNAGVLTRFRLLWPAMQPWREAIGDVN
eukprot:symbB.v1.2.024350.t1/scaffold2293.1/size83143/3